MQKHGVQTCPDCGAQVETTKTGARLYKLCASCARLRHTVSALAAYHDHKRAAALREPIVQTCACGATVVSKQQRKRCDACNKRAAMERQRTNHKSPKKTLRADLAWMYEELAEEAEPTYRGYGNSTGPFVKAEQRVKVIR